MGGNSGIPANVCLPTIVGIFGCLYDVSFSDMLVSSDRRLVPTTMTNDSVEAYIKFFRGKDLQVSPNIPVGWHGLLIEFFSLLERICDERELSSLRFYRICNESGYLVLNFEFSCELSEQKAEIIDARVFALRNRSFFSCSVCGCLAEVLTNPVLCKEHTNLNNTSLNLSLS